MGGPHLGYDAVSQGNGKGGCVVADRKGGDCCARARADFVLVLGFPPPCTLRPGE